MAGVAKLDSHPVRGEPGRLLEPVGSHRTAHESVAVPPRVDRIPVTSERVVEPGNRLQGKSGEHHVLSSVLGGVFVVGDDHGHRLSGEPGSASGQDGLRGRLESLVGGHAADLRSREVVAGEHRPHLLACEGLTDVEVENVRRRFVGANELGGQSAGKDKVGHEPALPLEQSVVFHPRNPSAEQPGCRAAHRSPPAAFPRACSTASTIWW